MTTFGPRPLRTRQEMQRLVELTSGRKALETLRQTLAWAISQVKDHAQSINQVFAHLGLATQRS